MYLIPYPETRNSKCRFIKKYTKHQVMQHYWRTWVGDVLIGTLQTSCSGGWGKLERDGGKIQPGK